jgi:hypothetical protein
MQRENDRGVPSHWWFENSLAGGPKSAAKRATEMEGSGSATGKWFCDGDGVLRRRWGSATEIRGLKRDVVYQKKKKEGCRLGLQKECGGNSTGEGEEGEERALVESQRKTTPFSVFSFNFNFKSKNGNFVTLYTQNDVVLGFPSILTVSSNGWGHFIRGW